MTKSDWMNGAILCVGEVLWDSMPTGLYLGGAPFNVACHLHRLQQRSTLVSRVGDDVLGREALRRIEAFGLTTDLVQIDPRLPTGLVRVHVDGGGIPDYEIVEPAAWDAIALDEAVCEKAALVRAVVFGSLAQRAERSRRTVQALCKAGPLAVFDVNLRPPFDTRVIVDKSLRAADFVKLNEDELRQLSRWFGWTGAAREAAADLAGAYNCRIVCITRGHRGAAMWRDGRWSEHEGFEITVRDTVGAGDAFLAAVLAAVIDNRDDEEALDLACRFGAFVATQQGATPDYAVDALDDIPLLLHSAI